MMDQQALPEWIAGLQQRAPEFSDTYLAQRQRILAEGAIPAKYKILMTMLVDALMAHPGRGRHHRQSCPSGRGF